MQDFRKIIKQVATFLAKTYTDEQIDKVADYLNIKNFKNNPMVNLSDLKACGILQTQNYVRKGGSGRWKEYFTKEMNEEANNWIEENLRDTDPRFSTTILANIDA